MVELDATRTTAQIQAKRRQEASSAPKTDQQVSGKERRGGPESRRRLGGDGEITQPGEGNKKHVKKEGVIDPHLPEEGSLQPGKIPEAAILQSNQAYLM